MKRLNRALSDVSWRHLFPEAYVETLSCAHSDHYPLLLRCGGKELERGERPFRFLAAWATHPKYGSLVNGPWHEGRHVVMDCLNCVRCDSLVFNKEVFGNIIFKKQKLEARIRGIQRSLKTTDSASLARLEKELQCEYNTILYQEELLWYQKSRENWVRFGDRNTNFFHTQTMVRRKRNRIHGLFLDDGSWVTDDVILREEARRFYQKLFSSKVTMNPQALQIH